MFDTLDEIIVGFEQALELERELGVRLVEFDRTQFLPAASPAQQPLRAASPAQQPLRAAVTAMPQQTHSIERNVSSSPSPKPPITREAIVSSSDAESRKSDGKSDESQKDFAFIVHQPPQGEAANIINKMIAAMGYSKDGVELIAAAQAVVKKPAARIYVILGSDAFRTFAPGQRAALGLWTSVNDVPTIVTYSPTRILSYFGSDAAGLTKAKRQIWSDIKSALARIGKQPSLPKKN